MTCRPNGPNVYQHPILGRLSKREIQLIKWDRKVEKEWMKEDNVKREKLNEIIHDIEAVRENPFNHKNVRLSSIVKKLERFRDTC